MADRDCHNAGIQSGHQEWLFDPLLSTEQEHVSASRNLGQFSSCEYSATQDAYDEADDAMVENQPRIVLATALPAVLIIMRYASSLVSLGQLSRKVFHRLNSWVARVQHLDRGKQTPAGAEKEVDATFDAFRKTFEKKDDLLVKLFKDVCEGVKASIRHNREHNKSIEEGIKTIKDFGPRKIT